MKFNKIYQLRVQRGFPFGGTAKSPKSGEWVVIELPITIEFTVDRTAYSDANTTSIKIYNLSQDTRAKLFHDRFLYPDPTMPRSAKNDVRFVELFAGYEGERQVMSLIFSGNLFYGNSTRKGSEMITELECMDPAIWTYNNISSANFGKGSTEADIIKGLLLDAGYKNAIVGKSFENKIYNNDRSAIFHGNTMKLIKDIVGDGIFDIDNEMPIVLGKGETIGTAIMPTINSSSGLINVPVKTNQALIVPLMFTPQLQVGQYVKIDAKETASYSDYNGDYRIVGVRHQGVISGTHDAQTTTTLSLQIHEGVLAPK